MAPTKTYGGKVGLLLIKKRKRLTLPSKKSLLTHPSRKAPRIESYFSGPKARIKNLVGWDDIRCRPIYSSKNNQILKPIYDSSANQAVTVSQFKSDCLGNLCNNSTPVRLPYGKENTTKIDFGTGTNVRRRGERITRSYGKDTTKIDFSVGTNVRRKEKRVTRSYGMKMRGNKRPSVAAASLLEQWRSPTKINERTFNYPKKLKAINKKLHNNSSPVPNSIEANKIEIYVSSLPSLPTKEALSDITSNDALDEFDFSMTPQPTVKSICSIMDSDASVKSVKKKLIKKQRILDPPRALILDNEEMNEKTINVDINKNEMNLLPRPFKSRESVVKRQGKKYHDSECSKVKRIYQPSPHSSLADAKAFFAQLDATEELTIDTSKAKNYHLYTRSENRRCVRTVQKPNLADPALLKSYASYRHVSKDNGLSPLALQMFAICRRDYFYKNRIYDGLLEDD